MKKVILSAILFLLLALGSTAATMPTDGDLTLEARAGYSVGATAPIGIPATIRKVNSFSLTPNVLIGIDARWHMCGRWALQSGLHFENKGMDAAVTTKGYHMAMVKGGERLEGVYTGRVEQHVKQWMLTLPLQACYDLGKASATGDDGSHRPLWRLRAGPYVSLLTARGFSGNVSDGYLRKDNPTGQKIEMGHEQEERATYDFSEDMRRWQVGVAVGADWSLASRLGLSADLSWGLTGIMHSDFKTVEQTLYPIYGTISITYKLK